MSLVAYGSSDESENEEETNKQPQAEIETSEMPLKDVNINTKLHLPTPKTEQVNNLNGENVNDLNEEKVNFDFISIPNPKQMDDVDTNDIVKADSAPLPKKLNYAKIEQPPKKGKGPAKISMLSLSDFKDLEEEEGDQSINQSKTKPSEQGSGLIGLLPEPKTAIITKSNYMIPHVLTAKPVETKKPTNTKMAVSHTIKRIPKPATSMLKSLSNYNSDSDSEDDKKTSSGMDFFSLSTPLKIPDELLPPMSSIDLNAIKALSSSNKSNDVEENLVKEENESNRRLVSNVMNLPKEEILLKNKVEVGPKLPVPEQEYNVDSEGNVAFDDKAIEYLCGKRGVKRKNEFNNVDILEINGEDIKPDEREWLVKALTEEPAQRPMSVGAGPSGQSKKKHQITYLAHQAKAMELELKNQWSQNKASRQATRSKYGF